MSNIGCLLSGISWLLTLNRKYDRICKNPELKATTSYFGIYAIFITIFIGGLFVLSFWGVIALVEAIDTAGLEIFLMGLFIGLLVLVSIFLFAEYIFGGLMGVIYQFRCNRRPISWIALAVFIVATIGMVVGLVMIGEATGIL